jgi:hypothetical protein
MNKFDRMYLVEFFNNNIHVKHSPKFHQPNFIDMFVLDYFFLSDSFLQCSANDFQDYYERCDEILKTVKIFP